MAKMSQVQRDLLALAAHGFVPEWNLGRGAVTARALARRGLLKLVTSWNAARTSSERGYDITDDGRAALNPPEQKRPAGTPGMSPSEVGESWGKR